MADPRALALALLALLPTLPAAASDESRPTPAIAARYDPEARALAVTFSIPGTAAPPEGTVFTLLQDGSPVATSTSPALSHDLSQWMEGVRLFTGTVTFPGLEASPASNALRVLKDVVVPGDCPVVSVTVYTRPPGASYTVYDECLPG